MYRSARLGRHALVVAFGATLLVAGPASAHPFIAGGQAPVDSLAEVRLRMSHGCGTEDAGGGDPTLEVAMEVAESMRIVEAPDVEEYEVALERDTDGRVEVVTWTATGVGLPAPELPFSAVFSGEPGTQAHLKVFQGCEGFTYRWVGTPDDPAEDPAVVLELVAADPDNPAPSPDEAPDGAPGDTDRDPGDDGDDAPDAGDGGADPGGDGTGSAPDGDTSGEDGGTSPDDGPSDLDAPSSEGGDDGQAATEASDTGGPGIAVVVGVALLALVAGGIVIARRSRRAAGEGAPDA